MRHLFKISFIILLVSSLAGCIIERFKSVDLANNVKKYEAYDVDGERLPEHDYYRVRIEGHWYDADLSEEKLATGSKVVTEEHYELTFAAKQLLKNRRDGDSGGGSGW